MPIHQLAAIIPPSDGTVAAIEVKASATAAASDFAALRTLGEQLGPRFRGGVVFYLGDRMVPFGEHLWLAPLTALWTG